MLVPFVLELVEGCKDVAGHEDSDGAPFVVPFER
jgi:hypothetical protein